MRLSAKRGVRPFASAVYTGLVRSELLLERMLDAASARPATDAAVIKGVTALVKTFERPLILRRLVDSIQRLYPGVPVVVVDDSRTPARLESVETIEMPYDSGISAGRNEGLRHVTTRYVLLLDDDFVLSRRTRLGDALALMEQHPEIDIMGGTVIDLPFYRKRRSADGFVFPTDSRRARRSEARSRASRYARRSRTSSSRAPTGSRPSGGIRSSSESSTPTSSAARSAS